MTKGYVTPENMFRYKIYRSLADQFDSMGDDIGPADLDDSTACWKLANKYRAKANELRTDVEKGDQ